MSNNILRTNKMLILNKKPMRHFSKLMLFLSLSIILFTNCYESALDKPAEKLSGNKVHAQMYVSLNYDDAVFAGDANVSNRRFIVEARDAENTENVLERKEIVYNTTAKNKEGFERIPVVFELDQKKYVVSIWMDYIESGTDKDFYYNTEDLSNISMITPESTANVHRDALATTQTIDLTEQALGTEFAVNAQLLNRIAKWQLIANDWRNLLTQKEEAAKSAIINVAYNSGVAKGFNLHTASTSGIKEGIVFEVPISVPTSEEETKITLAEDYFFISQNEEIINLAINVKSAEGDIWYTKNDISIACNAGKETKSENNYLTGEDEVIKDPAKFEGEGTLQNPYLIGTADNLNTLMTLINEGNKDYEYQTAYYKQTTDIDASSITGSLSIGNDKYSFKGTYDGDGKTISNNQGLFGVIEDATIKEIRLIDCVANTDNKKVVTGFVCNSSKGNSKIENCGCELSATMEDKSTILGSICGEVISGTLSINGCRVKGKAEGSVFKVNNQNSTINMGGFIGKIGTSATVNITDSYFTNSKNTFAVGKQADNCVGGLCGSNEGILKIRQCYVNAKLQSGGETAFGGIVVGKGSANISECYTKDKNIYSGKNTAWTQNKEIDNCVTQFATGAWPISPTWSEEIWDLGHFTTGETDPTIYPTLKWEN